MIKLGLVFISIILLMGCTSKDNQAFMAKYEKKQNYYKFLQKTEKVQFIEGNVTQLLVTATYMNTPTIEIDDKAEEIFLIGLHTENNNIAFLESDRLTIELKDVKNKKELRAEKEKKRAKRKARRMKLARLKLKDKNATLSVEDNKSKTSNKYLKPIKIKMVLKDDPILKGISFVSDWSQFYLVTYKHIAGNRLILKVKNKKSKDQIELEKSVKSKKKMKAYHIQTLGFSKVAKYAL